MSGNPTLIEMANSTFGRWFVLRKTGNTRAGAALWLARCECGTEREVIGSHLRSGKSVSCGCFRREISIRRLFKHGECGSRLYNRWREMRSRCNDRSNEHYGAKGIRVAPEWEDFANFASWASREGYNEDLILERHDINGDFEPGNCKWASKESQPKTHRLE